MYNPNLKIDLIKTLKIIIKKFKIKTKILTESKKLPLLIIKKMIREPKFLIVNLNFLIDLIKKIKLTKRNYKFFNLPQ